MIDERFCGRIGTDAQHKFACFLASKAGYRSLRHAASEYLGCSVSKMAGRVMTVKEASGFIDWLKAKCDAD